MSEKGTETPVAPKNFIQQIIEEDLRNDKNQGRVATRFPPEPNGYLHIGHAKAICLNFGLAKDYNGICNLRFDDTNPEKESTEYEQSQMEDLRWLGFDWGDRLFYASDYYEKIYQLAEELIRRNKAYVCHLNADQMREYRGTLTQPGKDSPHRTRSIEENLELFRKMRAGAFQDGECTLRAKIDMASPNINMRDPVLYRIRKDVVHYRQGKKWCIYPMYDYAHPLSDAFEGITHSLCTLEYEDHRPLYDWSLVALEGAFEMPVRPRQIEFSRLNLDYTVMSKRMLLQLVNERHVAGWDDPRMPTISGFRRRGYTAAAIRDFTERVGITKKENCIDVAMLESCIREDLDKKAPRALCVVRPLKVVIENYPAAQQEEFEAPNHPADPGQGTRKVPFSKTIYIEQEDFMENPPPKYFRLTPGKEVRLRFAYIIKCESIIKDPKTGEVIEVRCTYDPATRGGNAPDGRKIKGTIHWVCADKSLPCEVRLYDRLFKTPNPGANFLEQLNPNSLVVHTGARVEPALASVQPEQRYQFERQGYFVADKKDCKPGHLVFNRVVTLRDTWAKMAAPSPAGSD